MGSKPREDWREVPLDPAELRSYSSEGGHVVHERIGGLGPMGVSTHERRLHVLRLGSCGVPHQRASVVNHDGHVSPLPIVMDIPFRANHNRHTSLS